MPLTGRVPPHPAEFSRGVLDAIEGLLHPGEHVHDPFAGRGVRLGAMCDRLGMTFTGTDIDEYPYRDHRVVVDDSTLSGSYPPPPFTIVTSPVYLGNRISTDYLDGPTAATKRNGRHAYGISLGRALHRRNLARRCRRPDDYFAAHAGAVANWGDRVVVNVDLPIADGWLDLLHTDGYHAVVVAEVVTRRLGGVANHERRAEHEVVIQAVRAVDTPATRCDDGAR